MNVRRAVDYVRLPRWSLLSIAGAIVYGYGWARHDVPAILVGFMVQVLGTRHR